MMSQTLVKTRKKLIEVALPLPEINDASAYDKMPGVGPHPKGIHHWWARLPLPTARAILFASVVDDPACHPEKWPAEAQQDNQRERLFEIIRHLLVKKPHEHPEVFDEAWKEMREHCEGELPAVLDPFAGGGSIPLEASRLGFRALAADLNPVAVLLNKCNLELLPRWLGRPAVNPESRRAIGGTEGLPGNYGVAADVRFYAERIRQIAGRELGQIYPTIQLPGSRTHADVIAWIWARTVASQDPAERGTPVPLASTFILSSKNNAAWIEPVIDEFSSTRWRFEVRTGPASRDQLSRARLGTKAGKGQDFICLLRGTPIQRSYVQAEGKAGRLGARLIAVVADGPTGRLYLPANGEHERIPASLRHDERIEDARTSVLSGSLPIRAEITGGVCTAYGLTSWGHLFTDRQILALLTVSDAIKDLVGEITSDARAAGMAVAEARDYATLIVTLLALALDRCADFNNSLCRWSPSNQKVMNLFGKQAIPMVFDFAEANFLGASVGSWAKCSSYVADCVEVLHAGRATTGAARQIDAASEDIPEDRLLVSTDPPYYNNISYAVLSDFFYVWLRRTVGQFNPEIFGTVFTPKMPELIAAANRFEGDTQKAKEHFEDGFRHAFSSLRAKMDSRFPLSVYYAFKQEDGDAPAEDPDQDGGVDLTTGWETLLEALISSGFQITATWPVRASQRWRMVSMGSNALASYIVLACRPRPANAPAVTRRELLAELRSELPNALLHLQKSNIAPVDLAQAAIGPGMAVYTRYSRIIGAEGKPISVRDALALINQILGEVLAEQEGDFDAESRWALAWFEQFGFAEGEYGVAETLSKAKNTSISSLQGARVLISRAGKVRLLKPAELPQDWSPDGGETRAWEAVHHLIRVLESGGESAAAELVGGLGPKAEVAREMAYRLYTLCERKKRAQEAGSYNGLVQSWPEILRLAREAALKPRAAQGSLAL